MVGSVRIVFAVTSGEDVRKIWSWALIHDELQQQSKRKTLEECGYFQGCSLCVYKHSGLIAGGPYITSHDVLHNESTASCCCIHVCPF